MGAESPTTTIVAWTKKTPLLSVGDDKKVVSKVASSSSSSSSSSRHKASLLLLLCLLLLPIGQKNAHRFVGDSMRINSSSHIYTRLLFVCVREFDIYIYISNDKNDAALLLLLLVFRAREKKPSRTKNESKARGEESGAFRDHISHNP